MITLAITTSIIISLMIFIQLPKTNEISVHDKRVQAKRALYHSLKDSIKKFNNESDTKIVRYETSILEYKTRIANEKIENKARYAKVVAELDK